MSIKLSMVPNVSRLLGRCPFFIVVRLDIYPSRGREVFFNRVIYKLIKISFYERVNTMKFSHPRTLLVLVTTKSLRMPPRLQSVLFFLIFQLYLHHRKIPPNWRIVMFVRSFVRKIYSQKFYNDYQWIPTLFLEGHFRGTYLNFSPHSVCWIFSDITLFLPRPKLKKFCWLPFLLNFFKLIPTFGFYVFNINIYNI